MNNKSFQSSGFDLVRVSRAKSIVDVCPNTIRKFASDGLSLYRNGRAVFFSKTELESFIRAKSARK